MKFSTFLDIEIPFVLQCFENCLYVFSSRLKVFSVMIIKKGQLAGRAS